MTVKPHLLFRVSPCWKGPQRAPGRGGSVTATPSAPQPLEQQHGVVPDRDAEFRLFDRVVNVRENFSVPVGLRGTIIGIKGGERSARDAPAAAFPCAAAPCGEARGSLSWKQNGCRSGGNPSPLRFHLILIFLGFSVQRNFSLSVFVVLWEVAEQGGLLGTW